MSLGNTNRSSQRNPAKGETLCPIPVANALEISSDDSTEDTVLYTPLLNGKIRGTVFLPSALTVSAAIANTRTQIVGAGELIKIIAIRNTGANPANFTFIAADAAPDATNTIMVTNNITNGTELSLVQPEANASTIFSEWLYGPIYGIASAAENFRIVYVTWSQQAMA